MQETVTTPSPPKHIAIIMDGNGRWSKKHKKLKLEGHKKGVSTFKQIVKASKELKINYLSVYAFSTENWKRSKKETTYLMTLLETAIKTELLELKKENIKINIIGDVDGLKPSLQKAINHLETETQSCTSMQLNIMINYGSRQEIIHATQTMLKQNPTLQPSDITEDFFTTHLYTHSIPDPDILIRTSGEYRISNFLLWQLSYSELFFIDTLWPDFTKQDLENIIKEFHNRNRRFGGR